MGPVDLIDTTEMYLKTVFEMEEDGVVPMRARIVERLGHSGPTVSQTVARMERDGLLVLTEDRRLELTGKGRDMAREVMRKHRLAECLLIQVIGLDWAAAHEEACRWEHVMSDEVEQKLNALLGDPQADPYGNPIPGIGAAPVDDVSIEVLLAGGSDGSGVLTRIGEPVQADRDALEAMAAEGIVPGVLIGFRVKDSELGIWGALDVESTRKLRLSALYAPHLFVSSPESAPLS